MQGYPSWPGYLDFHALSMNGVRMFRIDGEPYDREAAEQTARRQAGQFLDSTAARLTAYGERSGSRGLMVFACDCELLGHWWAEGPLWLEAVIAGAAERGIRLTTLGDTVDRTGEGTTTRTDPLQASTWGERKDFRTWDAPAVADLTNGARKLELAVNRAVGQGLNRDNAERAARELLAVQSSDWAFLDGRRQAGDYAFERAVDHAALALEAIDCEGASIVEPKLRSLAPDLSLAPLLVP
jgi:1,4-alpha-glucan branching enzyme